MSDRGGRDPRGRFAVGNPGGPGRPRWQTEVTYLAAVRDAVPVEIWREIVNQAVAEALAGNRHAREWLSRYLVGDPAPRLSDVLAADLAGVDPVLDKAVNLLAASESDEVIHAPELREIRRRLEQGEAEPDADDQGDDEDVDDDIPPDGSESSEK
ncbi:MAG: hypothetical protein GYA33_10035 [Thermogutta sp.]|nr:hypothetical protein [Thermogutta sp.]